MIDYSEIEKKFKQFRRQLLEYRDLCECLNNNQFNKEIIEKEEKMRSKLTQTYGALAGFIHGMAGYVEKVYAGVQTDIFMLALYPIKVLTSDKRWGIEASLQCLDKADLPPINVPPVESYF
ncbi:MAG: hypothetical protein GTO17_10535 [Candidatus Aminicenantes bacterium]|nr:hypothetical protein [Candidatus Aminicenantes bacterium]